MRSLSHLNQTVLHTYTYIHIYTRTHSHTYDLGFQELIGFQNLLLDCAYKTLITFLTLELWEANCPHCLHFWELMDLERVGDLTVIVDQGAGTRVCSSWSQTNHLIHIGYFFSSSCAEEEKANDDYSTIYLINISCTHTMCHFGWELQLGDGQIFRGAKQEAKQGGLKMTPKTLKGRPGPTVTSLDPTFPLLPQAQWLFITW